jgi:molybdopterin molybdotransferase
LGLLASIGLGTAPVIKTPLVAILSTGDELASPGELLKPGQIYDSNSYTLAAAVQEAGAEPLVLGRVGDDPEALKARLEEALHADLILTTAGVSMGDYDFVRTVLGQVGEPEFWQIRMRPGKPLVFGRVRGVSGPVPLVGLPGNPVSALLTFLILVRPAILKMRGLPPSGLPAIKAFLDDRVTNEDGRRTFARVTLRRDGETWRARLTGPQGSSLLTSLAAADGLAIVPEDRSALDPGERATVLLLRELEADVGGIDAMAAPAMVL